MSGGMGNSYINSPAQNPGGFQSLGKTTLAGPAAIINVPIAQRSNLQIIFFSAGKDAADGSYLTLNGDTAAHYVCAWSDGSDDAGTGTVAGIKISAGIPTATEYAIIHMDNVKDIAKHCWYGCGPPWAVGFGSYSVTTGNISSVQMKCIGGHNFLAGSYVEVFGAD